MEANEADVKFVAELAQKALQVTVHTGEKEHFAAVPTGFELKSLAAFQYAKAPVDKAGNIAVVDVPGFAGYFNRFKDDDSMIFGDVQAFTFTGILDYHREKDGEARRALHKVKLTLQQTDRWKTWKAKNRQPMSQEEFATFIEDNLPDIFQPEGITKGAPDLTFPSAADMLEVSRSLTASVSHDFKQSTNLKNGQRGILYVESVNGMAGPQGTLPIPDRFVIRLPIFMNQRPTEVECRLRFKIAGGKLSMWYDMFRVDEMLLAEFEGARIAVTAACEREVILGTA